MCMDICKCNKVGRWVLQALLQKLSNNVKLECLCLNLLSDTKW
jgi:hypothetical protein